MGDDTGVQCCRFANCGWWKFVTWHAIALDLQAWAWASRSGLIDLVFKFHKSSALSRSWRSCIPVVGVRALCARAYGGHWQCSLPSLSPIEVSFESCSSNGSHSLVVRLFIEHKVIVICLFSIFIYLYKREIWMLFVFHPYW